jgi:hypothetical protein
MAVVKSLDLNSRNILTLQPRLLSIFVSIDKRKVLFVKFDKKTAL